MKIKARLLNRDAKLPKKQTDGSAGYDLYANLATTLFLPPGARALVPTGVAIEIPPGYEASIRSRSGLALKEGLVAFHGLIDSDYRGEISVLLFNFGPSPVVIAGAERIAQLTVTKTESPEFVAVEELASTERASGGFGSTGV